MALEVGCSHAEHGGDTAGHQGAGDRHAADFEQFADVEVQPHSEHQQDDTHFRQLLGDRGVGSKAGSMRADGDAGEEVADDGRQSQLLRDEAEDECCGEAGCQRQDEVDVMHGWVS